MKNDCIKHTVTQSQYYCLDLHQCYIFLDANRRNTQKRLLNVVNW